MSSYSLETICSIMSDGFEYHLSMDALSQINTMAAQLNIVSAQIREAHYVLNPTTPTQERDISQGFQSSTSIFERSKKKKSNKSYDVSNEEWGNVRSFQVTKIEPKKGLNSITKTSIGQTIIVKLRSKHFRGDAVSFVSLSTT